MTATLSRPSPPPAVATAWETEAVVIRGADRGHVAARAAALAGFLGRTPDVSLTDVAATLAAEAPEGPVALGVVASSAADLAAKLTRAAGRLADPSCRQIRDAAGVYFFDRPLYADGSLALLYPGEGAQYVGMLADVCGAFPEVEETFAWCDRIAAEAGRPDESLRKVLHLPADASPDQRAAAEAELRKIWPSLLGVLVADLAVTRLVRNLGLPVAAVAGHSAGELAALLAAGAMSEEYVLGPKLLDAIAGGGEAETGPAAAFALIAVGAGKAVVSEVAAAVAGGAVVVAMDNCPHQCVAVGPTHLVAAVESALLERGLVCERLPFDRPYHTPLFEPWMPHFRATFAAVPFATPHTPVYSCSTAAKFPADPTAIRDLTVNHWVTPVEFTRLIEAMHADGVRIFVEAGPRGNLSAFTEDVLRGKPFVAIPANLPRRNGVTQVNHLVAQLAAHGVPVNLGHLFARRPTRAVGWEHPVGTNVLAPSGLEDSTRPTDPGSTAGVMDAYLAVMERFLDVQREVMEAYLAGGPLAIEPSAARPEPRFALVGEIADHDPGRSIVVRRPLDLREDLHADDHTLGGRGVSRVDPRQNGLPILPMTFSLEAMAEAASLLAPGKVVTAIRNVRLFRWVPFDADPTTLEVRASVSAAEPDTGTVEVTANVRDLGNSFAPDAADKPSSEAIVVLADCYPPAPDPLPFPLTNSGRDPFSQALGIANGAPVKSTIADLRRNMFHGPLFQMLQSLDRIGDEGIEGTLVVHARDRWFASDPDPRVVIDPVLVDAAMHIIGAWHLEQPDWTGRILLPFDLQKLEFFGPPPAPGTRMVVRGHNVEASARHFRHGLEVFQPDGTLWLRLTAAGYWRFYLPFGDVNFFGPKDQYFLSRAWPDAAAGGGACYTLEPPTDLKQPVLRASGVRVTMTPREVAEYGRLPEAAQGDWFFTRLVAKDAVRAAWFAKTGDATYPADMESDADSGGRVVCRPRGESAGSDPFPPVRVGIANGTVVAFAAFAERVGLGLVGLPKKATAAAEEAAREDAAKRAVADALGISSDGMTCTPGESGGSYRVGLPAAAAARYPDFPAGARTVLVQTARLKDVIAATTICEPA